MKNSKKSIYGTIMIILALCGLSLFMYKFDYYIQIDKEDVSTLILAKVFFTKGIAILFMYISSKIYSKHFKDEKQIY